MLSVNQLKKCYGSFTLDCTLCVPEGSITGLIGLNGAGKSTTFKAILGLIAYDSGTIRLFDKEIGNFTKKEKEDIGVVLSYSGFSELLSARDLIPILSGFYTRFDPHAFRGLCEQYRLPMNRKIKDLSTGMRAKLKVLTALAHQPRFLILDEPTSGLDVIARDQILELLRNYMEEDESRSILISSHISSDLEGLCDDIYMIHQGSILLHEDTDIILSRYGILKMKESRFTSLDKRYMMRWRREPYGICCLTDQKQYYVENAPDLAVENGSLDQTLTMMIKGERL